MYPTDRDNDGVNLIKREGRRLFTLDIDKMLAELRVEREQIEEAILTLERLARGRGRRRGRPPSWLKEAAGSASDLDNGQQPNGSVGHAAEPRRRGRPPGSKKQIAVPAEA
jgi:hypothetical protein